MIKAIFFDIDGTLISIRKHEIPPSTLEAIAKVRSKGVRTFLCTSRARQFLSNIPGIEYDGLVCLTGAHCLDCNKNDISCISMDPGDVVSAVNYARKHGQPIVGVASNRIYLDNPYHPSIINLFGTGGLKPEDIEGGFVAFPDFSGVEDPVATAGALNIMQLICFFHSGAEEDEVMSGMPHSHTQRWTEAFVDIISKDTDKASGMENMRQHFGFSEDETMAVGDGANDIPMIKKAGIGIAMGNAARNVKDAADYVTDDVDEDGLANALEHFFNWD